MPGSSIKDLVYLDPVWAGTIPLPLPIIFARTGGGYLNCVDAITGDPWLLTAIVRRYDPRRSRPLPKVILSCVLTPVDPAHGHFLLDWTTVDGVTPCVPHDPGAYHLQVDLLSPAGPQFPSQAALFEVLPYDTPLSC